jgi:RNase H-like domain found in reverse transcriptase
MEKETFAIFTCLMKWEHHLRDVKFTLMTDHKNITFLNKHPSQKVMRWKLAIQEYDFDIIHIPGKDNIVAEQMDFQDFVYSQKTKILTMTWT